MHADSVRLRSRRTALKRALVLAALVAGLPAAAEAARASVAAVMQRDAGCGCCLAYADILRRAGFAVTVVSNPDMAAYKRSKGVPDALQSCHTVSVAGYLVEGHVPVAVVKRLVAERPRLTGIALPGMPAGSPGMGEGKSAPFRIIGFAPGRTSLYAVD